MSAFIGAVRAPEHNSPDTGAEVWCSRNAVELHLLNPSVNTLRSFDPIAARNLAALLVRASEEVERMRSRSESE